MCDTQVPTRSNSHDEISIFQHKTELLPSIRALSKMGYKLYASMGTGDFYAAHGVKVSTTPLN